MLTEKAEFSCCRICSSSDNSHVVSVKEHLQAAFSLDSASGQPGGVLMLINQMYSLACKHAPFATEKMASQVICAVYVKDQDLFLSTMHPGTCRHCWQLESLAPICCSSWPHLPSTLIGHRQNVAHFQMGLSLGSWEDVKGQPLEDNCQGGTLTSPSPTKCCLKA